MNDFRHLLQSAGGRPPLGTAIVSASAIVAEAVGHAGFDWGLIDVAQSPLDMPDIVRLLQAIGNTRMLPVLRMPWHDAGSIGRAIDAGAPTLLFPFLETAEEARRAVAATRHPPQGVRAFVALSRASRYGTTAASAPPFDRPGVIAGLGTASALAAIDEIAAVDGVDALFVEPDALAAACGHAGQAMHPAVMTLMAGAAERAQAAGKPIGTMAATPDSVVQCRAMGFRFIAIASDLGFLMRGAVAAVHSLQTQEGVQRVHSLTGGTHTDAVGE